MFFEVNGGPNPDWFRTDELNAVKFYGRGGDDQYWLDDLSTQDRFFGGVGNDRFYFTHSQYVGAFTEEVARDSVWFSGGRGEDTLEYKFTFDLRFHPDTVLDLANLGSVVRDVENFVYTINGAVGSTENDEVFRVIGTSVGETIYADNRTFQSSLSVNGKGGDDFIEVRD